MPADRRKSASWLSTPLSLVGAGEEKQTAPYNVSKQAKVYELADTFHPPIQPLYYERSCTSPTLEG